MERLFRRPRSKAKERLVEVLLELVATCKYVSVGFILVEFSLRSSWHLLLIMSLQAVFCFVRKEVSFSSQQVGQMQEGLHQEEFGECFLWLFLHHSPMSLTVVSSLCHLMADLPDPAS